MAEQIFTPSMAAMLRGNQIPPLPMGPPPEVMLGAPTITLSDLLRAGALGGPAMAPATLTGRENSPQPPPMALPASVDVAPIDYGTPMATARPLAEAAPLPDWYSRGRPSEGMVARPLMPQSALEEIDQRAANRNLALGYGTALNAGAVFLPTTRGAEIADAGIRGVGTLGRLAAESPPGRWVAGAVSRNPTMAGFLSAGGVTAATPGQTADAPPLRERAPGARKAETDVRGRLATAEEDLRKAREDVARYDDRNFNWRDPDAIEAAQRNFQGMDIRVRDPKTGAMVPVPSDRRDGPLTRQGAAEYARRAAVRVKDLETGIAATRTELERAGTAVREAEGLDARDISSRRMQELDEPTLVQKFGPNSGYAVGFGKGIFDRWALGRAFRGLAQTRADRANALMADMGKGDVNERVGRLNQFWTEGGSRNPPYPYTPGARPYPWTAAPDGPPPGVSSMFTPRDPSATINASRLYRPGPLENYGPIAGTYAAGGGEMYFGEGMIHDAERELNTAMAAISGKQAPTEAEMQRVRDARQSLAWALFTRNLGRGEIFGGTMTDLHMRAHAPARPNMGRAESERGDIDMLLNPPPAGPALLPPPAGSLPHSSSFRPRAGGRFAGPPDYPRGDPRRGGR